MTPSEAIKKVKESSKEKFDASVEVHINLDIGKEDNIRFSTQLPHGTGKELKVAVFTNEKVKGADLTVSEDEVSKLENGKIKPGTDFDILITTPSLMPKIAKVARVLGPAGVMPNPKNGTVAENLENAVASFKKGKIEIRNQPDSPVIHSIIGKVSFSEKNLEENLNEILTSLKQNKPQKVKPEFIQTVFICSSMGPSFSITL